MGREQDIICKDLGEGKNLTKIYLNLNNKNIKKENIFYSSFAMMFCLEGRYFVKLKSEEVECSTS